MVRISQILDGPIDAVHLGGDKYGLQTLYLAKTEVHHGDQAARYSSKKGVATASSKHQDRICTRCRGFIFAIMDHRGRNMLLTKRSPAS